ncbi:MULTISPECIES: NAD(P)/FAD-dependent oxidoreductase [unclassified Arcicella]|uniref:NAD(P)/FAD-dependent oxidoreductase n=1 Tax=unclassified Arcicella TaxID=2644986 RepID=UPI002857B560|nr:MULTISPECIES: NAD(P)/FAD-dependent oxidoreductase [unclassified Arcicella]MDR6562619.1 putative Rossmann fold flavoprotein [Arcicella sp. BE51]MDR6812706.1 putative Rossmann fold flavoprotein [Arcicella sp. BE140]MDR6824018.1 putative Rossmann fold flavoprotein [Arcicella sp. BE139]
MSKKNIIVIGAGAAGYFGAISAAESNPDAKITLLEKNRTVLNKVRISGGGRCNVTHACFDNKQLAKFYPRGGSFLKNLFTQFNAKNTVEWFEKQGVRLKTEPDGRMFPDTDSSETIASCLEEKAKKVGVKVITSTSVKAILTNEKTVTGVELLGGETLPCDALLITTGGNPQKTAYQWLADLGHQIIEPVPSLFTFNVPDSLFTELSGVSVQNASVRIAGKKLQQEGALLITHWGFSGPAILKLSAWGARELAEANYDFTALINWNPEFSENQMRENFLLQKKVSPKKIIQSNPQFSIPSRLWKKLCELSDIDETLRWIDISNKSTNKLIEYLLNCPQKVKGKTTFKEEFVTCGGINLAEVNPHTMESKYIKNLFFAGEVLDIDAVTGGFNFQAAWTTGFVAGKNM